MGHLIKKQIVDIRFRSQDIVLCKSAVTWIAAVFHLLSLRYELRDKKELLLILNGSSLDERLG